MSLYYNEKNVIQTPTLSNYYTDRKLVSIHSIDRDIAKWPNSNNFEVQLPEDLLNITSIRLINTSIPNNLYTFTNDYQNIKFRFKIIEDISGTSAEKTFLQNFYATGNYFEVTIDEGFYQPEELANELQAKLNKIITDTLITFSSGGLPASYIYNHFRVKYNNTQHKYYFINLRDNFKFLFDSKITYDNLSCGQREVWEQYSNWGLPYNLGFEKKEYNASFNLYDIAFYYDNSIFIADSNSASDGVHYISSPLCIDIFGEDCIYMELDRYNSIDEIKPYSKNTSSIYNNDYNGITNSAFAKIPLFTTPFTQIYDSKNGFINNITFFKSPLPKLRKMKFKFRYHDGRLVDFKNLPFSFTIEVMQQI
jgi:hypothetical protein